MGEPIVSPWIFYWIEVLGNLRDIFDKSMEVFGFLACIFLCLVLVPMCATGGKILNDVSKYKKQIKNVVISVASILIVTFLFSIFIPSQDTMYKMLVAHYITVENINIVGEITKETISTAFNTSVDRLIEVINATK